MRTREVEKAIEDGEEIVRVPRKDVPQHRKKDARSNPEFRGIDDDDLQRFAFNRFSLDECCLLMGVSKLALSHYIQYVYNREPHEFFKSYDLLSRNYGMEALVAGVGRGDTQLTKLYCETICGLTKEGSRGEDTADDLVSSLEDIL